MHVSDPIQLGWQVFRWREPDPNVCIIARLGKGGHGWSSILFNVRGEDGHKDRHRCTVRNRHFYWFTDSCNRQSWLLVIAAARCMQHSLLTAWLKANPLASPDTVDWCLDARGIQRVHRITCSACSPPRSFTRQSSEGCFCWPDWPETNFLSYRNDKNKSCETTSKFTWKAMYLCRISWMISNV